MLGDIRCKCGNKNQAKFFSQDEIVGFTDRGYGKIPVRKFIGWLCGECGKVQKDNIVPRPRYA